MTTATDTTFQAHSGATASARDARTILHVDMDAFFASVEQRDRPEQRGKPVIVGAPPDARGVVSTCSYEARRFGVRSAMPSREAFRLCPHGVFVAPDMDRYMAASARVFAIFDRYTPLVEGLSCDEAFLDVSGAAMLFGDAVAIAGKIRADISRELGLTASVGVATNKFLAKIASDMDKPDGLTVVPADPAQIAAFLSPLPVGRIFGVGKVLGETLAAHGLKTVGDVQRIDERALARWIGAGGASALKALSLGIDGREVEVAREGKSVSREHTFPVDESDRGRVRAVLLDLAADVARQVRAAGTWAATAHLKLRTDDFRTVTRQKPFPRPCCDDFSFREAAAALFDANPASRPIRLVGFGTSGFSREPPAASESLFGPDPLEEKAGKREALSRAMDEVRERFGASSGLFFAAGGAEGAGRSAK